MKRTFLVTIDTPESVAATRQYIRDAITTHGGAFPPEHPFFNLTTRKVKVEKMLEVRAMGPGEFSK